MPKCSNCGFIGHSHEQCSKKLPPKEALPLKEDVTKNPPPEEIIQPKSQDVQSKQDGRESSNAATLGRTKGKGNPPSRNKQVSSATKSNAEQQKSGGSRVSGPQPKAKEQIVSCKQKHDSVGDQLQPNTPKGRGKSITLLPNG